MTRAGLILLSIGTALFIALLSRQGFGAVVSTLAAAGWGLLLVSAFHLIPLVVDARAITVMVVPRGEPDVSLRDTLFARWVLESVNSLLPVGQIGGPVLMARYLSQKGVPLPRAAAAVTVSTTMQVLAQIVFTLAGIAIFSFGTNSATAAYLRTPALISTTLLAACAFGLCLAQRRGLFGWSLRILPKAFSPRNWPLLATRADAIDAAVSELYGKRNRVISTFWLSFAGWVLGTGEVWLALYFLGHPVSWVDALLLECVGQSIRGTAFMILGSLGAQEGGYLLLAPLVGLPPDAALALSLAKRVRELAFGLPGILYLHFSEKNWQRNCSSQLADQ
ncbi:MAG: lysylphosphatidylglycerol synthase domain-containing protein [Burkholderia sp.]|nr:MAG: hypothetical protein E5299_02312 [Burkholderia gladioli]